MWAWLASARSRRERYQWLGAARPRCGIAGALHADAGGVSSLAGPAPRVSRSRSSARDHALGRALQYAPVVVVAVVLALSLVPALVAFRGNATGFVWFGRAYVTQTHPPSGALVRTSQGYDGQYFWAQATDPLLLSGQTRSHLRPVAFRLQRVAYPMAAFLLAGGHEAALPWALLAINVFLVLMLTSRFRPLRRPSRMVAVVGAGGRAAARVRGRHLWRHERCPGHRLRCCAG